MVMEAWPSISETTFALTPSLRRSVAHVWRRSWKRRSSRTLARALMLGFYRLHPCVFLGSKTCPASHPRGYAGVASATDLVARSVQWVVRSHGDADGREECRLRDQEYGALRSCHTGHSP